MSNETIELFGKVYNTEDVKTALATLEGKEPVVTPSAGSGLPPDKK
jgi:hypothetical protein